MSALATYRWRIEHCLLRTQTSRGIDGVFSEATVVPTSNCFAGFQKASIARMFYQACSSTFMELLASYAATFSLICLVRTLRVILTKSRTTPTWSTRKLHRGLAIAMAAYVSITGVQKVVIPKRHINLRSKSVVLTSYFTFANDPQRHKRVTPSFNYLANFWNTAHHHGLEVVIVHDDLPKQFIHQHSTSKIRFHKVSASTHWSTNDYRFYSYLQLEGLKNYDYALISDISDVFYNSDPFLYMSARPNSRFFVSLDQGSFHRDAWMVKRCYGDEAESWDQQRVMYNAGVWGGRVNEVICILDCIVREIERVLMKRKRSYNCNMPTFNWCVHNSKCLKNTTLNVGGFVNPFMKRCRQRYPVIHNKCKDTEGIVCVALENLSTSVVIRDDVSNECSKLY